MAATDRATVPMLYFEYSVLLARHLLPFWMGVGNGHDRAWIFYVAEEKGILGCLNAQEMAWGKSLNLSELLSLPL